MPLNIANKKNKSKTIRYDPIISHFISNIEKNPFEKCFLKCKLQKETKIFKIWHKQDGIARNTKPNQTMKILMLINSKTFNGQQKALTCNSNSKSKKGKPNWKNTKITQKEFKFII